MSNKEAFLAKFEELPEEEQQQVLRYLEVVHNSKKTAGQKKRITFGWAGALKDVKISAVELQHKANEWR